MKYDQYSKDKFVIFSWTRTGGSNLGHIINLHSEVTYVAEPFNLDKKIISKKPKDVQALKKLLKNVVWKDYNCLKHNHGLNRLQNTYLLSHPQHKVIFLWRKNALKRAVSQQIAINTNIWGLNDERTDKIKQMQAINLQPLNINAIKNEIKHYLEEVEYYKKTMIQNNDNVFEVAFEDLFDNDVQEKEKLQLIDKIFDFLDLEKITDSEKINQIKWRLAPKNMKQSAYYDYDLIPNIAEIRNLGSDSIGYL